MHAIDAASLGAALVTDGEGVLVALVTDGDVRRALLAGAGLESSLRALGSRRPVTAPMDVAPATLRGMFDERIRMIPLVDARGRVVDVATFDPRSHIAVSQPQLGERELEYVTECLLTGWISSSGRFVPKFEQVFAEFCGTPHALATSNGTTALHLALAGLGVGPGDEVIVPTLSFIATANAVRHAGATPVFVDSEPGTGNIDPAAAAAAVSERTKAILAVHLFGHPADVVALRALCDRHGLLLVEDAAEAHGAMVDGRPVGSFGDAATFSFFGNKIVTTGEGGMVVTPHAEAASLMRMLRDHGMDPSRRFWHPVLGYNYRLTNVQAAIGVAQMERIEAILEHKRRIAEWYTAGLTDVPGLSLPMQRPGMRHVHWLYAMQVDPSVTATSRDAMMLALRAHRVDSRPFFPPMHLQPVYNTGQHLPVAEAASARGLCLPSHPALARADVDRIADLVRAAAAGRLDGAWRAAA